MPGIHCLRMRGSFCVGNLETTVILVQVARPYIKVARPYITETRESFTPTKRSSVQPSHAVRLR